MAFTLDWFMQNIVNRQQEPQPPNSWQPSLGPQGVQRANNAMQTIARNNPAAARQYGSIENVPSNVLRNSGRPPMQGVQAPQFQSPKIMQQGSGRPPRVPGPRNPMGRKRVPQVPQQAAQQSRINRKNWLDWVNPNEGGGSFR